ncbi:MAG: 2-C-methyl-D-erythritol 4-phosphate cytidylyltransferase [Actinomycetes bacterium]
MPAETPTPSDDVWAVVVAAGSGQRFGGAKQFAELGGTRVLDRSVAACRTVCGGVVVVLAADVLGTPDADVPGADAVVAGGATRSESVRRGLAAVPATAEFVLVHDAARPLVTAAVCTRVVDALRSGATAVVPAVPVTDTVRTVDGQVLDRSALRAVQTPQGFRRDALVAAHATEADASDDAGLMELLGEQVALVEGDPDNLKVTGPSDLTVAAALLRRRAESGAVVPGAGD